jgi:ATP-dependent Clp protease ATP-binding subunit ClpB
MTDGQGRTVDFKNTIIIMTSNVGSQIIQEAGVAGSEAIENQVLELLRRQFKPEFLNRIDDIIFFHSLSQSELSKIVDIQTERLCQRLEKLDLLLSLSPDAKSFLSETGYDPVYGARPLKRVIQRHIENPLSMEILRGDITDGDHIHVTIENGQIAFKKE